MRLNTLDLLFLILLASTVAAQPTPLTLPIEGTLGSNVFIVNHVDHDTTQGALLDYACGEQTYDGHQGTDFVLRSFRRMDSGVYVLAAAPGRVITVVDTAFDRNKESVPERGFGNYIGIVHPGGIFTYYAHLRKGSARVKVGDSVTSGRRIGLVGSSGNSTDPHLHFEVWDGNDTTLIDPFAGECGPDSTHWKEQPEYDSNFGIIDYGMLPFLPTLDTLRERPGYYTRFSAPDTAVVFWIQTYGIREGDSSTMEWFLEDGSLWYQWSYRHDRSSRYAYWWSSIRMPLPGNYIARYSHNGIAEVAQVFTVLSVSSTDREELRSRMRPSVTIRRAGTDLVIRIDGEEIGGSIDVSIYDIQGSQSSSASTLRRGSEPVELRLPSAAVTPGPAFVVVRTGNSAAPIIVPFANPR